MYVSQLSSAVVTNKQLFQTKKQRINTPKSVTTPITTSTQFGYYVPFKANVTSKHLRNFEKLIDNFFAKYKGELAQSTASDFRYYCNNELLSISRLLNDKFRKKGESLLKNATPPPITEPLLITATAIGLENIKHRLRGKTENFSYETNFPLSAEDVIKNMKETDKFPQEIGFDSSKRGEIRATIIDELLAHLSFPAPIKSVLGHDFTNGFDDYLKKNNIALLDEKMKEALKNILQESDFVAYSKKMDEIEAKDKTLSTSLENTTDALYEDLINNNISPFENPKYYDYLSQNEEKTSFLLEKLIGITADDYINRFDNSQIDKKHKVLLANPMFIDKLDKLIDFVETQNINTRDLSPIELQNKFSDYLGTETVYLGLLTKEPKNLIENLPSKKSFYSSYNNSKEDTIKKMEYYLKPSSDIKTTLFNIDTRRKGFNNEFIEAALFPESIKFKMTDIFDDNKPVIIKATVPKLHLVEYSNYNTSNSRFGYDTEYERQLARKMYMPFTFPLDKAEVVFPQI